MSYQAIREYSIQQKAKNVAETPWLILPGENKLTRRAIKISFIKDHRDFGRFVGLHAEILFQKRKNQKESWPEKLVDLRNVPNNFGLKIQLDTAQTYELAQALQDAYPIGQDNISSGKRTVIRGAGKDEVVVTEKNKVEVLKKVSGLLSEEEVNNWIAENISSLSADLALVRIYRERKSQLAEFEKALNQDKDENFWQKFLKKNSWMFGVTCIHILDERRIDIHHETDFPLEVDGGFMDIAEIKKPSLPFWTLARGGGYYKYRGKFFVPNPELQGALAQTTKYILQAEKKVNDVDYIKDHGGVVPLKPRGLVIHGRSNDWKNDEWEAYRLLNDELHTVQILSFDQLYKRAERMLAVMEIVDENPIPVEVDEINPEDIPF
jgi:hypothetical protein